MEKAREEQHSVRCEVCELLSRDTSNKESEIISRPWDAVTAEETHPGSGKDKGVV